MNFFFCHGLSFLFFLFFLNASLPPQPVLLAALLAKQENIKIQTDKELAKHAQLELQAIKSSWQRTAAHRVALGPTPIKNNSPLAKSAPLVILNLLQVLKLAHLASKETSSLPLAKARAFNATRDSTPTALDSRAA